MRNLTLIYRCARRLALPRLWAAMSLLAAHTFLWAQTAPQPTEPYATIDRSSIDYAGPDRGASHDLSGNKIKIGLILPLTGARKPEGDALLAAAQMAVEDEAPTPLPGALRLELAPCDESGLWGRASSEIVKLVVDDRAIALVTSPDGRAAHLAEQVGNRLGVPVVSLASDSQNTQINIPWYFRMVPDDAAQARLFADDIYHRQGFQKVRLVTENDHDGRVGKEEFEKAARRLQAPEPKLLEIAAPSGDFAAVATATDEVKPQAIVFWASADVSAHLLAELRRYQSDAVIYVCHKALQHALISATREPGTPKIWIAAAKTDEPRKSLANFDQRFRERTGAAPNPAAREMYDAVRLITAGVRAAGPNRARLRDSLAKMGKYQGISGLISFDGAGNNQAEAALIRLPER
ncbi:MAG: ABC transporter substrate-binding protein [Terriglobia bacterium]